MCLRGKLFKHVDPLHASIFSLGRVWSQVYKCCVKMLLGEALNFTKNILSLALICIRTTPLFSDAASTLEYWFTECTNSISLKNVVSKQGS